MYFRRVLVGLNLENLDLASELALPLAARSLFDRAVELAASQNAMLRLCAVVDGLDLTQIPAAPQQISMFSEVLASRLEALAEEAGENGVECETSLVGGNVRIELLREANEWEPDLLVVGAGSRANRWSSSVAELVRTTRCSMLVERPQSDLKSTDHDDSDEPVHVLLADDLGPHFESTLMRFVASGLWRDAKCWLTNIVEPDRWPEAWQMGLSPEILTQRQATRGEAARLKLHNHLAPTDHRTMTYGILPHVVSGTFADTLERLVTEWDIHLFVCGSGPRAETLCPALPCSTLVWRNGVDLSPEAAELFA